MSVVLLQMRGLDRVVGSRLLGQLVVMHLKALGILMMKELNLQQETIYCPIKM